MAEEEKKFPMGIIAVMGIVFLLLAGGISYYIASYFTGDKGQVVRTHEPGVLYKVGDPKDGLIVNIGGGNNAHFLKTSIILELLPSRDAAKEAKGLNPEEVKITDAVVRVLRSQKIEDFDAGKQDTVRDKIKAEVNSALGDDKVIHVYITSFVLQ